MIDLVHLAESLPQAARLLATARRAASGDRAALESITSGGGWADALEMVSPGSGQTARTVLDQMRSAAREIRQTLEGDIVEAEYRVIDGRPREPWSGFMHRLFRQRFGGHVLLGPMGQGKTSLAKKLAWRWRREHGYVVECVELYGDDRPDWAVSISMRTLVRRMEQLRKYLDSQAVYDRSEPEALQEEDDPEYSSVPATPPVGRRVIIIDEAGMAMERTAGDPGRKAALRALAQCRHLDWIVLYLGQCASQIPLPILGQTTVWVKQPAGKEIYTDRDNPVVRDLWEQATAAFLDLRGSPWYVHPVADPRAWAYCDCPSLNGIAEGYRGLIPFTPAPMAEEEDPEGEGNG